MDSSHAKAGSLRLQIVGSEFMAQDFPAQSFPKRERYRIKMNSL